MLSQGQFFDAGAYQTGKPQPQFESAMGAAAKYLDTGSTGETGLADREARRSVNRLRKESLKDTGGNAPTRVHGESVPVGDYGVGSHEGFWDHDVSWLPHTHRESEWQKFGKIEEAPYNRIVAGQPTVAKQRVNELVHQPGSGIDPRYSGSLRPLPHAVRLDFADGPGWVLHQGHHRTIADMQSQQPQMFHPLRTVTAPETYGEVSERSADMREYRTQRWARTGAAKTRANAKDFARHAVRAPTEGDSRQYFNTDGEATYTPPDIDWSAGTEQFRRRGPAVLRDDA